ncbi:MAG: hypothetical protein UV82_C0010G0031 [Candidatus Magasanikbacteria bacterium GW2011_GWD2_43_18]|uniref:Uncharacterized protein n=1 Tax=Candidatus Magasanikbacteria bacterium GW2011_GWE2_42_7 TaxID=1619052 RepID=A0A0G1DLT1_9BACT|nr:MAG: hypothetical protein UV18_C0005G0153 [Candidatus Magasanikbacteria bacterium GW2011_GWC2_42_27]KKS71796.1 MAG: hypothetical protein UV42_C0019G0020 [Candidatus Magasanikbacteria bacterium GW2011_GWE2_42_7]KKT04215.1 MAG: hypothetical protein UV82_C0010G0031 [Candidatus Magasanikbacteria bacterium GW2011_GWD2_43_18]KKT25909.1 MAG: hypothetical protein UW10_C0003G0070 [Candidatus Magasanikbacteria bacterium GW2011_GWA2_43_9]
MLPEAFAKAVADLLWFINKPQINCFLQEVLAPSHSLFCF